MNHSPAPWVWTSDGIPIEVETFKSPGFYDNPKLKAANGITVVGCGGEYMPYENPADAKLIAAAPEMLALLQRAHLPHNQTLHMDGQPHVDGCHGCDWRALLAKIEGETP